MAVGEIIVHGAGGHSRVVTDVLLALGFAPAGFVEDEDARDGLPWLDSQIIGWSRFVAEHSRWACLPVALAVGDNAGRARAATRLKELGHHLPVLVHPSAVVSHSAVLGEGTVVMPLAAVNPGARIGAGVIVNTSAVIEHDCEIGDFAHLSPRSVLGGGARVESLAHLGLGAVLLPARKRWRASRRGGRSRRPAPRAPGNSCRRRPGPAASPAARACDPTLTPRYIPRLNTPTYHPEPPTSS